MRPFTIDVPTERLEDLRARLSRTRLPRTEPRGEPWTYGTPQPLLRELLEYWRDGYDWRAVEARLNRLPQYVATVDGYEVHVVVERGSGPAPLPLVLTMMGLRPHLGEGAPPLTAEEERWQAEARERLRWETGYQAIQGTKPQTLAYALTDSPTGLLAWIVEKFHGWSEPDGDRPPFSFDQLLTNVMIYWVTESL